jgi:hypothetical protein
MPEILFRWWKHLFSFDKKYSYHFVDEVSDRPNKKIIYLITHQGYCWQIFMICPCGCRKLLYINAVEEHRPYWRFDIDNQDRIFLYPSIHRQVGCKSHFFVRNSKIDWC